MKRPPIVLFAALILGEITAIKEQSIHLLLLFMLLFFAVNGFCKKAFNVFYDVSKGFAFAFLLFAIIGFSLIEHYDRKCEYIESFSNKEVTLVGTFTEYETRESGYSYILADACFSHNKFRIGKVKVYCKEKKKLNFGNRIKISGTAFVFDEAKNEGSFDSNLYYKCQNVLLGLQQKKILSKIDTTDTFRNGLSALRRRASEAIDVISSNKKKAGIIKAAVLGVKNELDSDTKNLYKFGGIMHLLAISGLHISAIGMVLFKLLRRKFGFALSSTGAFFVVMCFVVMTGMSVSALRAGIMFSMYLVCKFKGRKYDALSAVGIAGIILCLNCPYILLSSSMQMSFGAILSILVVYPVAGEFLGFKLKIVQGMLVCICINLFLMPVLAYNYFEIMPYSIVVNAVTVPLMVIVIVLYIAAVIIFFFTTGLLASAVVVPADKILDYYEWVCALFENKWGKLIVVGRPEMPVIFMYYSIFLIVVVIIFLLNKKKTKRIGKLCCRIAFVVFCFVLCFVLKKFVPNGLLILTNYVGQGECIVMECEGKVIMSDCGSSDIDDVGIKEVKQTLLAYGINRIDYLFVSHTDSDHISGIADILRDESFDRINIRNIIIGKALKNKSFDMLLKSALLYNVNVSFIEEGKVLEFGNLSIKCLFPGNQETDCISDANDSSLILDVSYNGFDMLLTGDTSSEMEKLFVDRIKNNYDVLKIAHHGSAGSSSERFLKKANPQIAIISCGENNRYGHPHKETIRKLNKLGCKIFRTDQLGQICINVDDNGRILINSKDAENENN